MADVVFHGGPVLDAPETPAGEVALQAPPALPRPTPQPLLMRILPLVMLVAVAGSVVVMLRGGMAHNPMALMFPVMMGV